MIFVLAISDVIWQALIVSIATTVVAVLQSRTKDSVGKVSQKVDDNTRLTQENCNISKSTNVMVNGNITAKLHVIAMLSHRVADLTKDPIDIGAAQLAEQTYQEHFDAMRGIQ